MANNDKMSHSVVAILQLMLMLMLNIVWHARVAEAATATAKPGCQQQCGKTVIHYPFGIGNSSCFHDEWFEMECSDSNTEPFLKKLKVEVLEIHLPINTRQDGWILFNNPIMASSSDCTSGSSKVTPASPLDMTGSPFYWGRALNRFAGSGCSSQVSIIDSKGKQVLDTECTSTCPQDTTIGACCKTDIPDDIQLFNVSFSGTTDGCKYAVIASKNKWLDSKRGTSCSSAMRESDSVPAWLSWGFKASSPEAIELEQQSTAENAAVGVTAFTFSDGNKIQFAFCAKGFEGNAYLPDGCQEVDECSLACSTAAKIGIVVGCSIVGVLLITLAIWGGFKLIKRRQVKKFFVQNGGLLLETEEIARRTKLFKEHHLLTATNNFSKKNVLGGGGQGTVYKGTLPGGTTVVAIKKCKKIKPSIKSKTVAVERSVETGDEMGAFITEVVLLSETIHKNIVRLLGCCLETEAPLLVYEYLVNGDLSHHLQNDKNSNAEFTLSWEVRLRIAADIAGALSYLHFSAGVPIYHRDIKSDNILLDNKYTAKLADFGISKSLAANESRVNVEVQGSPGYIDPEYMDSKQYTEKSDVYSFGVVLAELLTGKRPVFSYTSSRGEEKTVILADHFKSLDTAKIMSSYLDSRVKHQGKKNEVEAVIEIAKRCLEREGRNRPTMKDVDMKLEKIRAEHTHEYAEEIDEHEYDQYSMDFTTSSQLGDEQSRPLRRHGSLSSDDRLCVFV